MTTQTDILAKSIEIQNQQIVINNAQGVLQALNVELQNLCCQQQIEQLSAQGE